jgi:hypothetical protein
MTPRPCSTRLSEASIVCRADAADDDRATGTMPVARSAQPSTGTLNRLSFAMKRGARPHAPHGDRDDERVELRRVARGEDVGALAGSLWPSMISILRSRR